jgi:hypothetical protein
MPLSPQHPTHRLTRRCAERIAQADPHAGRPAYWPFGALTEAQVRARNAQESAARMNRLARWPAGQPAQQGRSTLDAIMSVVLTVGMSIALVEWLAVWILTEGF